MVMWLVCQLLKEAWKAGLSTSGYGIKMRDVSENFNHCLPPFGRSNAIYRYWSLVLIAK